jgi:hypothetical protein
MNFKGICINVVLLFLSLKVISQDIEVPVIQYVTVDRISQLVKICWTMNQPLNVDGYYVKRQIFGRPTVPDGSIIDIAIINNNMQMCYIDTSWSVLLGNANPGIRPETYRVIAYKNGPFFSPYMSLPLSTI